MLNPKQIAQFQQNGYLVLEGLIEPHRLERLKSRADDIISQWHNDDAHIFSTKDNDRCGDAFFFDSAEKISCFFEEEAFDPQGRQVQAHRLCINKIGHALHELDDLFEAFSHQRIFGEIAADVGMKTPQIRQSMYIFKQPRIGGEVNWHQDASFFYTTPQSVLTFWFAIEDATIENGCLWVESGGHKGPLREQFKRKGSATEMEKLSDLPWPDIDKGVSVEVKAGTLVLFHGLLPHYSAPNRSSKSRQAYTLHVTDGDADYAAENWLQAKALPLRGFDGR